MKVLKDRVAALRQAVAEAGRHPNDVLIFAMMTVVVADTDAEAQAKLADFRRYASFEGALTLMSGWAGADFADLEPGK